MSIQFSGMNVYGDCQYECEKNFANDLKNTQNIQMHAA